MIAMLVAITKANHFRRRRALQCQYLETQCNSISCFTGAKIMNRLEIWLLYIVAFVCGDPSIWLEATCVVHIQCLFLCYLTMVSLIN